ncbi:MAG: beta-lactamase family protein [Prevotella sp.]|nr:beta-lactamase family protein [Staphylococcus sp.]MCM1350829.1 beta-lactamase family protein [Prevotella sp.]
MHPQDLFFQLSQDIIIHPYQGYAFYFEHKGKILSLCNGKEKDSLSANITFDTHFRLASISKQFIAYAIIQLVESGNLRFDTPILDIYTDLPAYFQEITIFQLLHHTSGILDYEDMPHQDMDPQIHDEDIIPFLKTTTTTYFTPGTQYRYSNTGYILLGRVIEAVSSTTLDDYLKIHVFEKAGLQDTLVNHQGITKIKNRAYGHVLENKKLIIQDQYWCSATIADGGIYSTIADLKRWINYLLNQEEALQNTMFCTYVLANGLDTAYGMGMGVISIQDKKIYYHWGDTIGTNTLILFSKDYDIQCIFLTNLGNIDTLHLKDNIIWYIEQNR